MENRVKIAKKTTQKAENASTQLIFIEHLHFNYQKYFLQLINSWAKFSSNFFNGGIRVYFNFCIWRLKLFRKCTIIDLLDLDL